MGSSLGPTLANIFVGFLENELFLNCKMPFVYLQYVVDTFVKFENKQENSNFKN